MKKQHLLLTLIVFSVASCFAQQNSKDNQNNKPYLKKYLTNGITVELWGFNKDGIFIPEGKVTTYYSNKQKALEGNYKNGKAEGNWKLYYENGQLKTSADYSMGSLNGELKTYYDNGSIASLLPYSKGFIDGTSIYYNTNNAKRYEITFYKNNAISYF